MIIIVEATFGCINSWRYDKNTTWDNLLLSCQRESFASVFSDTTISELSSSALFSILNISVALNLCLHCCSFAFKLSFHLRRVRLAKNGARCPMFNDPQAQLCVLKTRSWRIMCFAKTTEVPVPASLKSSRKQNKTKRHYSSKDNKEKQQTMKKVLFKWNSAK